ncbi:MAG: FMN-dependent NADH-azoreductase [Betaproteobacteria bacterium]|nr:MAG: FMN-dependent NADH-azoreductase [Betaproteobacteria bacterium]
MNTLLHLSSSIYSGGGESSRLARAFVDAWMARNPRATLIERDLALEPVPHLDAARFRAFSVPAAQRTETQQAVVEYSDRLIGELKCADAIVLGLPMYNFGIPSTLKAYFDHVARAGVTFRYTDKGSVGLLTGKRAFVFAARGGRYGDADPQADYVRNFLRFLGIEPVRFVLAEGLALGEEVKRESLARALEEIDAAATGERWAA